MRIPDGRQGKNTTSIAAHTGYLAWCGHPRHHQSTYDALGNRDGPEKLEAQHTAVEIAAISNRWSVPSPDAPLTTCPSCSRLGHPFVTSYYVGNCSVLPARATSARALHGIGRSHGHGHCHGYVITFRSPVQIRR